MSWTIPALAWVNGVALGGRGMSELPPSDRLLPPLGDPAPVASRSFSYTTPGSHGWGLGATRL